MRTEASRWSSRAELAWRWVAVIGSAQLFALAFPPLRWHLCAWFALWPFFAAIRNTSPRVVLSLSVGWSILFAYSVGDWMPRAIPAYFGQPTYVGWAFFLGVATVMVVPYYTAFAFVNRRIASDPRFSDSLPLWTAAAFTTAEFGRGRLFTGTPAFIGNPWALTGYSQVDWILVVQVASATGIYGISFAIAAFNAGILEAGLALQRRERTRAARSLGVGALPALLVVSYGFLVLRSEPEVEGPNVSVAVVQGNIASDKRWRADRYGKNLEHYVRLTTTQLRESSPAIVVWPESSMTFFLDREPAYQRAMLSLVVPDQLELIAGGPRWDGPEEAPRFYNSMFRIGPTGQIHEHTDKEYLVPFTEFFPLRGIDFLRRSFERVRTFVPGEARLLHTRAGPAAIAICNEAMLPEVVAQRVADGASWIINPSNDTWIPEPRFAEQQLDIVRVRAVEQRRWLVRASTAGPSAFVDPHGRVTLRSEIAEATSLISTLVPRTGRTIYGVIGDSFAIACAVASILGYCVARPHRRRRAESAPNLWRRK